MFGLKNALDEAIEIHCFDYHISLLVKDIKNQFAQFSIFLWYYNVNHWFHWDFFNNRFILKNLQWIIFKIIGYHYQFFELVPNQKSIVTEIFILHKSTAHLSTVVFWKFHLYKFRFTLELINQFNKLINAILKQNRFIGIFIGFLW